MDIGNKHLRLRIFNTIFLINYKVTGSDFGNWFYILYIVLFIESIRCLTENLKTGLHLMESLKMLSLHTRNIFISYLFPILIRHFLSSINVSSSYHILLIPSLQKVKLKCILMNLYFFFSRLTNLYYFGSNITD